MAEGYIKPELTLAYDLIKEAEKLMIQINENAEFKTSVSLNMCLTAVVEAKKIEVLQKIKNQIEGE